MSSIIKNSAVLMETSKKNTLTAAMVLFEAQRQGHTIYWTECMPGPVVPVPSKKRAGAVSEEPEAVV